MRGIKLKSYKNFTKNSKIISYDKPKHVYIPLICYNDINFDVKISIPAIFTGRCSLLG